MGRRNALKKPAAAERRVAAASPRAAGRTSEAVDRSPGRWSWVASAAVCIGLALAVAADYAGTRNFDFVWFDDDSYVFENPHIKSGLTRDNLVWVLTSIHSGYWHPVTSISHMIDSELYQDPSTESGQWAGGHHFTNMLIHAATAIVLFLALRRLTGALWPSALAAAVFALHPQRVESVAWVAERKDVVSGFFFTLTLLCYAGYARRPSIYRYALVMLAFVLALMSKPMVVTLPFVLLLLDYWPLGRLDRTADPRRMVRLVVEKAPLLILAALSSVATVYTQDQAVKAISDISLSARFANAAVSYVAYIRQMFWPDDLAVFYPHPRNSLPGWQILGAIALLGIVTAATFRVRRTRPYLLVGWLWYLGMLVPVIGLMQSGYQARADRFTYLPQIGLIVGLTWLTADLARSWMAESAWSKDLQIGVLGFAAGFLLFVLSVVSWQQTHIWHDSITLFEDDLAHTTQNYFIEYHLGLTLGRAYHYGGRQENLTEAIRHLGEAHRLNPNDYGVEYNFGVLLGELAQKKASLAQYKDAELYSQRAEFHLRRSAELRPTGFKAAYNLGIVLYQAAANKATLAQTPGLNRHDADALETEKMRMLNDAWIAFDRARELNPLGDQPEIEVNSQGGEPEKEIAIVYFYFGGIRFDQGKPEDAVAFFREAIERDPDLIGAYANLGKTYYVLDRMREAVETWREALHRQPNDLYCLHRAAFVASTSPDPAARSGSEAVAWAEHAQQILDDDPQIVGTLAAAYAEVGRFDDAIKTAKRALELATKQGRRFDENKIRGYLSQYQAHMPVRGSAPKLDRVNP